MDASFYTVKEVADLLKISVSTVRRLLQSGAIQATKVGLQKQIRIEKSVLTRFINEATTSPILTEQERFQHSAPLEKENSALSSPDKLAHPGVRRLGGSLPNGLNWTILNGQALDALRVIPNESVNCAVTSPPYYWQRDYEVDGQIGHESTIEGYVDALVSVFRELRRTLTNDGTLFLNLGDTYYSAKGKPHGKDDKHNGRQMMRRHLRAVDGPGLGLPRKSLIGIPWRVAIAMQADGWTLRSSIIWHRPASLPEPTAHDRPWRTFEHVFLFSKSPKYWFNRSGLVNEEDVWTLIARPENPGSHFAPYPRELVDKCLACGCPDGGTVLDPFVGSGTTMVSALAKGCNAIGIELKPEYSEFATTRIKREFGER